MLTKNFLLIASGNLISRLGTVIFDVVLAWWLVSTTGTSVYIGIILAASNLPIVIIGPIAGVLSDRWNKKWTLVITDLISGIVVVGVSYMIYINYVNIYLLVASSFILGVCTSLFKPTLKAIIPDTVEKDKLVKANSITTNISETTKLVGPVIGGGLMLVPFIGVAGSIFINGMSFIVSAIFQMLITYNSKVKKKELSSVIVSLKEGFRFISDKTLLRNLIYLSGAVNFFLVSFNVLLPLFVDKVLNRDGNVYSYALSAEAFGGIAISILLLTLKNVKPNPSKLLWLIVFTGLSISGLSIFPNIMGLIICCFLQGLFLGAFNIFLFTYIQEMVNESYLGRVFSIVYMIAVGVMPVSYLMFGFLGNHVINYVFIFAGLGTILCTIPFFYNNSKVILSEERNIS